MNKIIYCNIISSFLPCIGPAESFHLVPPAALDEPLPEELHQLLLLPTLYQLDVDDFSEGKLLLRILLPIRGRRPINRRPPATKASNSTKKKEHRWIFHT